MVGIVVVGHTGAAPQARPNHVCDTAKHEQGRICRHGRRVVAQAAREGLAQGAHGCHHRGPHPDFNIFTGGDQPVRNTLPRTFCVPESNLLRNPRET